MLSCGWAADAPAAADTQLIRVERHPTHDVAVIHFQPHIKCSNTTTVLDPNVDESNTYFVAIPPSAPGEVLQVKPVRPAVTQNETGVRHTLVMRGDVCLQPGDSGTPLFKGGESDHRALSGLLIGGDPDCNGIQTFVRLDSLREWLTASIRQ